MPRLPVLFLFLLPSCFRPPEMMAVKLATLPSHEAIVWWKPQGSPGAPGPCGGERGSLHGVLSFLQPTDHEAESQEKEEWLIHSM